MEERTTDEIALIYKSAGDSVFVINNDTTKDEDETDSEWKNRIKQNVEHLELIKGYKKIDGTTSIWTTEDFSAIDIAIVKGKTVY